MTDNTPILTLEEAKAKIATLPPDVIEAMYLQVKYELARLEGTPEDVERAFQAIKANEARNG